MKNIKRGWDLLRAGKGDSSHAGRGEDEIEIPAIGDVNSIQWALHKKVGDVLDYPAEDGRMINLRLVGAVENSILQGSLLIDEEQFRRYFPNESGYRMLLIESQGSQTGSLAAVLKPRFARCWIGTYPNGSPTEPVQRRPEHVPGHVSNTGRDRLAAGQRWFGCCCPAKRIRAAERISRAQCGWVFAEPGPALSACANTRCCSWRVV